MAQQQFTTYQADILSFELREALLGIAKPGRYQGWTNMVANGTPGGGNIPIRINHGTPGFKKGSHAVPPVLGSAIGVAISTQGTIIHDDLVQDKNIAINGVASIRWDIFYMEHIYVDSSGANNATFGIQQGVAGNGIPVLSNPEKRVIIGLVKISANGSIFSSLTYYPKQSIDMFGDSDLARKLWGDVSEHIMDIGTVPSGGVIGPRTYTNQYNIVNYQSITTSLDFLDIVIKSHTDSIATLNAKKLDDMATPDDNTDLNASTSRHGLLPKLSGVPTQFFNGSGYFSTPVGKKLVMRTAPTTTDFDLDQSGLQDWVWYTLNLSAIVPGDADVVILRFHGYMSGTSVGTLYVQNNDGTGMEQWFYLYGESADLRPFEITLGCDSQKRVRVKLTPVSTLRTLHFTVIGWQTSY